MTAGERAQIHKFLDQMIDQGQNHMEFEYVTPGDTEFSFYRKYLRLGFEIREKGYIDGSIRDYI